MVATSGWSDATVVRNDSFAAAIGVITASEGESADESNRVRLVGDDMLGRDFLVES